MKYISTRDPSIQLTASQAILKGISPEGGLFVPEEFPQVDLDFIRLRQNQHCPERRLRKPR